MKSQHKTIISLVCSSCFGLSNAQDALQFEPGPNSKAPRLEQIIVTAQKRSEKLQDVPISIVALDGDRIAETGLTRMDELKSYVPSLNITETGIGTLLYMRGIGSGINQGFEQSVGTYVDGVYRGRAQQSRLPFLDLQRIEVLRGSQSTLFGKHTIAGALNITTAKPTNYLDAKVTTSFEPEVNGQQVSGFVSGPLSDSINARLAVHARETDGWFNNITLDRNEAQREERIVRATVDWQPIPDFDLSFKAEVSSFDVLGRNMEIIEDGVAQQGPFAGLNYAGVLQYFGQDASVTNNSLDLTRSANGDTSDNDAQEFLITANYYGWGDMTFSSLTAYSNYGYDELCDCDYTGAEVFSALFDEDFKQFSQEFRLVSPDNGKFKYLLGMSYYHSELNFFDTIQISSNSVLVPLVDSQVGAGAGALFASTSTPRTLEQETNLLAAFGQAEWYLTPRTRLTLGGRLTSERKTAQRQLQITDAGYNSLPNSVEPIATGIYAGLFNISNHDLRGKRTRTRFLPSIALQHRLNDNHAVYFSASRGEKSGGFDARSNNAPARGGSFEFGDEQADTLEIGSKLSFLDGNAEINTAVYFTEFDQMQVSTFDGVLGFNVGNAARAVAKGIELDGRWRVTDYLMFSGSVAFSDFEFKEHYGQCYFGQVSDAPDGINCNYAGRRNQFQADYDGRLSAEYRRSIANSFWLSASVDALFSDEYLLTATQDPRAKQDAYVRVNARFAVSSASERWEAALLLKNITDERVKSFGGDVPMAGSRFGAPGFYAFVEQGSSVVAQLSFSY